MGIFDNSLDSFYARGDYRSGDNRAGDGARFRFKLDIFGADRGRLDIDDLDACLVFEEEGMEVPTD